MASPLNYSTLSRSIHEPVPANTQDHYVPVKGHFRLKKLLQTDVLDVIRQEPLAPPALETGYEVSLSEMLKPVYRSVGKINFEGEQLGSCTLISWNLGIIACHCIEGFDVSKLTGTFENFSDNERHQTLIGRTYNIECVVEYDPDLDYAIVRFTENPGKEHGFVPLHLEATANTEPALLHHPIGKPLKVSIRPIIHLKYDSPWLQTYHDSDYGSSGGAYISPSRFLVAIHLGAERDQMNHNLVRLALPTCKIIDTKPNGIIARLASRELRQKDLYDSVGQTYTLLPFIDRNFIDLENYDSKKMIKGVGYVIRHPFQETPGIIIDSHQKKHLTSWPTDYGGKPGSKFPESVDKDDLVTLGKAIAEDVELFSAFPPKKLYIQVIRWALNRNLLERPLLKKLIQPPKRKGKQVPAVNGIGIEYGWDQNQKSWAMHFYPITEEIYEKKKRLKI